MLNLRSRREIDAMRKAGELVWQAHAALAESVRPGVTTAELNDIVEDIFRRAGAEAVFKTVAGPVPFPAATCISVNEQIVHGVPGDRPLHEGDIVSVDTACRLDGWCGDAAVTHPVGAISREHQRLLEVTAAAFRRALELIPQCRWWSQVASEMERLVKAAGCSVVRDLVGHGVGRELHEPPQVPNFAIERGSASDFELLPGLVLAIEPMVNAGGEAIRRQTDGWTQVTADGRYSAHFEHTVAIGPGRQPRLLTGPPENSPHDGLWPVGRGTGPPPGAA